MEKSIKYQTHKHILFISILVTLYSPWSAADGNHPWAKSEAWTWMGHLFALEEGEHWNLSSDGYAFIHYYTRNETGYGRMNFKSSAVTKTKDGVGVSYDKKTTFPEAQNKHFQLSVSEQSLNIDFRAPGQHDQIREAPMSIDDLALLEEKLLPLFPGLKIKPQWEVKKYTYKVSVGSVTQADLTLYSLWPDIAPPGQKMKFFGIEESYTFSSPMLLAYGSWQEKNQPSQKVTGLCFLDRQWSRDYFGKNVFSDPTSLLKKQHALNWAHNWSAFHAFAPETQDWYFVHLWRQVQRQDGKADEQADYTGVQWSKNGEQQPPLDSQQFSWNPTKFTLNQSNVLMNFAEGKKAYFPFSYEYHNDHWGSHLEIEGSPKLQSLDQPIYLYEGYARGEGTWDHQKVIVQGRIESSQILFRDVDYQTMLSQISKTDPEQNQIASELEEELNRQNRCSDKLKDQQSQQKFLFHDMSRKLQIFSAQFQSKPKRTSAQVITYY